MKKTRLQIEYEYDFELFGITSSAKFFKLAWAINLQLGLHLIKKDDFEIEYVDGQKVNYLNYYYEDDSCYFHLFKNKSPDTDNNYIIPEMPHYDYVLKMNGTFQSFAIQEVLKVLREVKYIEYIAPISLNKLKSKDNFLN